MPKKPNKMKLPNGYGQIRHLSGKRRKPWAVYPPATESTPTGMRTPKALGYVETWQEGYEMLVTYNLAKDGKIVVDNGTFDEKFLFQNVMEQWFTELELKNRSENTLKSYRSRAKHLEVFYNRDISKITHKELQDFLLKYSGEKLGELVKVVLVSLFRFAKKNNYVKDDLTDGLFLVDVPKRKKGTPFKDEELKLFWNHTDNEFVKTILIMCYSGFRVSAYLQDDFEINLEERYFRGGIKTESGKQRIVPIHSAIFDFVKERVENNQPILGYSTRISMNEHMTAACKTLGLEHHTPHDTRRTFSTLCEKYEVKENDRKRLLGHAFNNDVTNQVYSYRTVEELRTEIEKIGLP